MKAFVILFLFLMLITVLSIPSCSGGGTAIKSEPQPQTQAVIGHGKVVCLSRINSIEDEFAPCLSQKGTELLFTSNRSKKPSQKVLDPEYRYGEALYSSIGTETNWNEPTLLSPQQFTEVNTGTASWYGDEKELYLTGTYRKNGAGGADIILASRQGNDFPDIIPVPGLNSPWWDGHPALSADGKIIVFASDRSTTAPSTETESRMNPHVWMAKKQDDGTWSNPVRISEPVNSDASEISPHFGSDGYLYFASNRNPGKGYDIFRTKMGGDGAWQRPEVLPEPVNSAYDDCFPWQSADKSTFYFASNRPGGFGGFDIWAAECFYAIQVKGLVQLEESDGKTQLAAGVSVFITPEGTTLTTDDRGAFSTMLQPCTEYKVTVGSRECYEDEEAQTIIPSIPASLDTTIEMSFTLKRKAPRTIRTYDDNVPYFVTGYWKPNTTDNYNELQTRMVKDDEGKYYFPGSRFIDIHDLDEEGGYEKHTAGIDAKFSEIEHAITETMNARSDRCSPTDKPLEILVIGYVDPLGLSWGVYPDETVKTMTVRIDDGTVLSGRTIEQNSVMSDSLGNVRLSHLRAFYTYRHIDARMRSHPEYVSLMAKAMIKWSYTGGYIPPLGSREYRADPLKRKFEIRIR